MNSRQDSERQHYHSPAALLAALDHRLRVEADHRGIDINRLRRQVAFERLLDRLCGENGSEHATWVLKGGLALEFRLVNQCRSTRDLDIATTRLVTDADELHGHLIDALANDRVGDHFGFAVGLPKDLAPDENGRPGWRFPIEARLAAKTFVKVRLDVVARAHEIAGAVERLTFPSALAFAGYPPSVTVPAIDIHQHAAEKFHALTRDYGDRPNTRTKDLVDLVLLIERGLIEPGLLADRLHTVFAVRATHEIPAELPPPPAAWREDYAGLVTELDVEAVTVHAAHILVDSFWKACVRIDDKR